MSGLLGCSVDDRCSTTAFCTFVGGNLLNWKAMTQTIVACSITEAESRGMVNATCEMIWLKQLMKE